MSPLAVYILVGDLLVSGAVVGVAIWLLGFRRDDPGLDAAGRIPLEEPPGTDD